MAGSASLRGTDLPNPKDLKEPSPGEVQALSLASEYDFRLTACPRDNLRARFPEWVSYYRMKWAIARALQPASILEVGVRYGYSALAFLDACPHAHYLGIDIDSDEFGGTKGAIDWARKIAAGHNAEFLIADSQKMSEFPGGTYDLIHVDGQQDGDGSFHDLQLAVPQGRFVLLDGFFWTQENFQAVSDFLFRYRDLIDYYFVIPGYAGELLIKPRPSALVAGAGAQVACSEELRGSYTSEYYLQDCGGFAEYRSTGGKQLLDDRLTTVAALASLKNTGRILDIGCGRGELAYYFAQQGFQVTAVDYSEDAVRLAEQTFAGEPDLRSKVELSQANICDLDLSGSYDIVIASDVVEHLTPAELDAMYEKVSRHLGTAGIFLVHTYPNLWYFRYDYARRRRLAASLGAYLPKEPRTRYELLMHINEQNPRVLKRQLARYFPNVLLWFGELDSIGGSLLRKCSHAELAASRDLWAIASHLPVSTETVRSRLESKPLPPHQLSVIRLATVQAPAETGAGQRFAVAVEISNRSAFVLGSMQPSPVHISYHWMSGDAETATLFDGIRTPIRPPLAPGATRRFEALVDSPPAPGRYVLRMTLVQEGVQWFDAAPIHVLHDTAISVAPESPATGV